MRSSGHIECHVLGVGVLLTFLLGTTPAQARDVRLDELGVRFVVPDDAEPVTVPSNTPAAIARMFRFHTADGSPLVLAVAQMPGIIERGHLVLRDLPPNLAGQMTNLHFGHAHWGEFEIDVLLGDMVRAPEMTARGYILPIRPRAVQFVFVGRADHDAETAAMAERFLSQVTGPSNWQTRRDRMIATFEAAGTIVGLVSAVALWMLRRKKVRRSG